MSMDTEIWKYGVEIWSCMSMVPCFSTLSCLTPVLFLGCAVLSFVPLNSLVTFSIPLEGTTLNSQLRVLILVCVLFCGNLLTTCISSQALVLHSKQPASLSEEV